MLPFSLCTHCCKSERSVPLLPLYALLWSFVARSALVPLESVAFPETMLTIDFLTSLHQFSCFEHAHNLIIISWWDIHDHTYLCDAMTFFIPSAPQKTPKKEKRVKMLTTVSELLTNGNTPIVGLTSRPAKT